MASPFEGTWKGTKSENFEEYLKEVGMGMLLRKAAAHASVTLVIKKEGDQWKCQQLSTFKNSTLDFKLDEEFEETTPDGRKFRSLIKVVDGKLVHTQKAIKPEDRDSVITRWVEGDTLIVTLQCGDVISRREYARQ